MIVHCIGDSHVCLFSGKDSICDDPYLFFKPQRIGAYLAHSLGDMDHGAYTRLISCVHDIPKEDWIMLSYGEIDIRVHVVKESLKQGIPVEKVVENIVKNYSRAIDSILGEGRKVLIWCPPPTCNHYNENAAVSTENPYPHIGTIEQRNLASLHFKECLLDIYAETLPLVDVYDFLLNEDNTSKGDYFMDGVHLSQKAMPFALSKIKKIVNPQD